METRFPNGGRWLRLLRKRMSPGLLTARCRWVLQGERHFVFEAPRCTQSRSQGQHRDGYDSSLVRAELLQPSSTERKTSKG